MKSVERGEQIRKIRSSRFLRCSAFILAAGSFFLPIQGSYAGSWGNSPWDDRRAEVAFYDAERIFNDKPRAFKEELITIKEPARSDTFVKADLSKGSKTIDVFKLNDVLKLDTENYPVSELLSVVVTENPPDEVLKLTVGSQDWMGNTFKVYRRATDRRGGTLDWYSYFDGEADQSHPITLEENELFEDQLPITFRALPFKAGYEKKIRLIPSQLGFHATPAAAVDAVVMVTGEELVRCQAGSIPCWMVTVNRSGTKDTYWFERKNPNILVKMVASDGRKRLLTSRARWSYWDKRIPKPKILY